MRLDKLLTVHGFGSKRTIKKLLFSKQVQVNDRIVMQENLNVDPQFQMITVSGKPLTTTTNVYYMLNKPAGVVCAVTDIKNKTVIDLLQPLDYKSDIYPVGRLDADTTGLLLLTNNGQLGYQLLHPKFHVSKMYEVIVNGPLDQNAIESFKNGVIFLDGTTCQPADLIIVKSTLTQSKAFVTICEGKFHQVKKMFLSVGVKVTALKRVRFGPLLLDESLNEGDYRALSIEELEKLAPYFK